MLSLLGDVNNLNGMKSPDVHPTENISANHGSLFIASVADTLMKNEINEIHWNQSVLSYFQWRLKENLAFFILIITIEVCYNGHVSKVIPGISR